MGADLEPIQSDQFDRLVGVFLPSALENLGEFVAIDDSNFQWGQVPSTYLASRIVLGTVWGLARASG